MTERPNAEHDVKSLAFHSAIIEAWVATRMEKDRTLVALAAGGVGLVATLLATAGPASGFELALFGAAAASFAATIVAGIIVFEKNSGHLEAVIIKGIKGDDPTLVKLDRCVFWSFLLGVVLTASVGLSSGYTRLQEGAQMSQHGQNTTRVTSPSEQKSLTGIGNLAPQLVPAPSVPSATPADAPAVPAGNTQGGAIPAETPKQ